MPEPELSRLVATDRIPSSGMTIDVEANAEELSRVAARLMIPSIRSLSCRFVLTRPLASGTRRREGEIVAEGMLKARVTRDCVLSLEPFSLRMQENFRLRFVPAGSEADDEDPESDDELGYEGSAIDLGEALVEQLALGLDPYPRKPGVVLAPEATDPEEGAFAALARLRAND